MLERLETFDPLLSRFASKMEAVVDENGIGSIATGVTIGSELIWDRAFGMADRERGIPADPKVVYRIGSVTKHFTATLLMQLAEQGKMSLDEPVEKYLPEVREIQGYDKQPRPFTLRELASHTSGVSRETERSDSSVGSIEEWEKKLVLGLPEASFPHNPGEHFLYSNFGFGILGLAVSRVADRFYPDLLKDQILDPLGMSSTALTIEPLKRLEVAKGYMCNADGSINTEQSDQDNETGRGFRVPTGNLFSTVADLSHLVAAQTASDPGIILSGPSLAEMRRMHAKRSDKSSFDERPFLSDGYGLGLDIELDNNKVVTVGHSGGLAGYSAAIVWSPTLRIGVIILRNYKQGVQLNIYQEAVKLVRELSKNISN